MHIVIGTSLYIDHSEYLYNKLDQKVRDYMRYRIRGKRPGKQSCLSQFTLLNGWKKDFATKNQVRQDYFDSEKRYRDASSVNHNNPIYTSSVNDDFENMKSRIPDLPKVWGKRNSGQERVKTFLYKMLNDDEIDKQQSNEFQFMRSDCERLTVVNSLHYLNKVV